MTQKENNDKVVSFEEMIADGNLIPPTGHLEGELVENPLKGLSCAEVSARMDDFCGGQITEVLLLKKIIKHLNQSIHGRCNCSKIFLEIKQRKEARK